MPRAQKIRCAYAEPERPVVRPKKPRVVLTAEEKAEKKAEAAARAEAREKKKAWEESLTAWTGQDPMRGTELPEGTESLFKSDAKKYYELSNKDLEALPFYQFACSRKRIIPLAAILAHVQRRLEATGIPYPKLKPEYTVKSHRHVKHLTSHCSIMENLKIMKAHFEGK